MKYSTLLLALLLASCATNTGTGVIAGGVFGASICGATYGSKGAVIGSTAAMITCGLIGAALDVQDRRIMEKNSPRTVDRMDRGQPLTINDVIKLSQNGVSDDAILRYMQDTSSAYTLTQAQIRRLQDAGVSQRVINEMIAAGR